MNDLVIGEELSDKDIRMLHNIDSIISTLSMQDTLKQYAIRDNNNKLKLK